MSNLFLLPRKITSLWFLTVNIPLRDVLSAYTDVCLCHSMSSRCSLI